MAKPLAEQMVQPAIDHNTVAYCPTMDLVALVTADGRTHVYRLNGQEVFGLAKRNDSGQVGQIRWKPNGKNDLPNGLPGLIRHL